MNYNTLVGRALDGPAWDVRSPIDSIPGWLGRQLKRQVGMKEVMGCTHLLAQTYEDFAKTPTASRLSSKERPHILPNRARPSFNTAMPWFSLNFGFMRKLRPPLISTELALKMLQCDHRRRSSVNFWFGGWKINKMLEFYMIYARKKLTKCPNFTWFLPEKYFSDFFFLGGASAPCPPSPTPMNVIIYLRRRLASEEGIVSLGVRLSRCVCVRRISLGGEGKALQYPVLSS